MPTLKLYEPHKGQAILHLSDARFKIITCGRRWGKTLFAANDDIRYGWENPGCNMWWVAPTYNQTMIAYRLVTTMFNKIIKDNLRAERRITLINDTVYAFKSADRPDTLRGEGNDKLTIDEAALLKEGVWDEVLRPTLADRQGSANLIFTPKGHNYVYHLYQRGLKGDDGYKSFHFPSHTNPFLKQSELDEIKRNTHPNVFAQEYMAEFISDVGAIIKRDWWQYYTKLPDIPEFIWQSWDTAFKEKETADYSVCTTWCKDAGKIYLMHVYRDRVPFPTLKKEAMRLYNHFKPNIVLIEDKASGQSLIQEFANTTIPVKPIKVDRDKIARANAISPLIESGKVYLPETAEWLYDFMDELSLFPNGKHDDQVDSLTQALEYVHAKSGTWTDDYDMEVSTASQYDM
jgi:predicted phage terminase large subunit-like protein